MVICISANAAIDRRLYLERLLVGEVNRAKAVAPRAGGKAANLSFALRALGEDVQWIGFLGGATGDQCEEGMRSHGIDVAPVRVRSTTRMNLEILETNGAVTEVLEPGGEVDCSDVERLLAVCREHFHSHRPGLIVVLSGSVPPGAGTDLYAQLIKLIHESGHRAFLDASGHPLLSALDAGPEFVKVNRNEVGSVMERSVDNAESAVDATRWLISRGAKSAAVSLGAQGLIWLPSAGAEPGFASSPRIQARSTVGCGDSTLAGFIHGMHQSLAPPEVLRLAVACGAANCLAECAGRIRLDEVERLRSSVQVRFPAVS